MPGEPQPDPDYRPPVTPEDFGVEKFDNDIFLLTPPPPLPSQRIGGISTYVGRIEVLHNVVFHIVHSRHSENPKERGIAWIWTFIIVVGIVMILMGIGSLF